jgi:cell division protein ZapA
MKQLEVQIMGQSYLLGCPPGGEARLRDAVTRVDGAMCKIRDAGKVRARDRIAVLAAVNLAFDLTDKEPGNGSANHTAESAGSPQAPEAGSDEDRKILHALLGQLDEVLGEDGQLL